MEQKFSYSRAQKLWLLLCLWARERAELLSNKHFSWKEEFVVRRLSKYGRRLYESSIKLFVQIFMQIFQYLFENNQYALNFISIFFTNPYKCSQIEEKNLKTTLHCHYRWRKMSLLSESIKFYDVHYNFAQFIPHENHKLFS